MAIHRRSFLKATVTVAGAVFAGASCGDDPQDPDRDVGGDTGPDADIGGGDTGGDVGRDVAQDVGETLLPGAAFFSLSVASGDPRPGSVIVWTRLELDGAGDATVRLQVALDEAFSERVELDGAAELFAEARAEFDRCVKVRVTGLDPATTYYYRFVYDADDGPYVSAVGRARTAPTPDTDASVRFAFVSCQDYTGRYYNVLRRMAEEDLDFFVHLGDYIYETTGNPSFQTITEDRSITFDDQAGSIELGEGDGRYYAAASLDNYRQLYRTYRRDENLQRVHELFPMVAVWDDHEFADDCHGVVSTMTAGREDETDPERRAAASKAWFEYMPVDYRDPDFEYDTGVAPPDDIVIYRDLEYGSNVHLVMTDLRLYRADHPVPEDAFPGAVYLDEDALMAQEGALPDWAEPYVDTTAFEGGTYEDALRAGAPLLGYQPDHAAGLVAVRYINRVVSALIDSGDDRWAQIDDTAALPRGLAFITLGKASAYSSIGSRYLAIRDPYLAYARARDAESGGDSENVLGDAQESWFLDTMRASSATWKIWGNEFCLIPRVVDTRNFAVPPDFQQLFLLSTEDWDGCPNRRDALIAELSQIGGVVAVTGDIHAFFAGTPWVEGDREQRIVEFVTGAISSGTYERLLLNTATADPILLAAGAPALALLVNDMLLDTELASNPHLSYANINRNGFVVVEANAEALDVTFFETSADTVRQRTMSNDELDAAFSTERFRVPASTADLYREIDGTYRRWDPDSLAWV